MTTLDQVEPRRSSCKYVEIVQTIEEKYLHCLYHLGVIPYKYNI